MDHMRNPGQGFAFWRIGLWLVLMLSAFGALQYGVHARRVWLVLAQPALADEARTMLHGMLAWDLGYFVAAAALVVFCAAGILRQGWSRPVLRVALGLLALGLFASGATLLHRWRAWSSTPHDVPDAPALLVQAMPKHWSRKSSIGRWTSTTLGRSTFAKPFWRI